MNPFSDLEDQQVQFLGERRLIAKISEWIKNSTPTSPHGIGDDAAIINIQDGHLIVTKDSLVYQKHFDDAADAQLVGEKLLKRNLSDLAAMGAKPDSAVIACLLPPSTSVHWLRDFYHGLETCASEFEVKILGGDITSTFSDLAFTLTLFGRGSKKSLTRKSSTPGDTLWVTGSLGGSILGKHLTFTPRLKEGAWLAQHPSVTSGMDLSDGLATDLKHLCPEDCFVELNTDEVPISKAASTLAASTDKQPIQHALTDGEDYELLFTVKGEIPPKQFAQEWNAAFSTRVTRIGKIMTRQSDNTPTIQNKGSYSGSDEQGYEHFR